ncbi:MAG: hypothetical protein ACOC6P_02070 [Candidatus Aminicenantaceae bacterium]
MEKEKPKKELEHSEKLNTEFLEHAQKRNVTVRDEQYEFPVLLDAIHRCRKAGYRYRLIDSGRFDISSLEWLGEKGADVYSSDEYRIDPKELEFINISTRKGNAITAYLFNSSFESEEQGNKSEKISFSDLLLIGNKGIYIHLSNRNHQRDISKLTELADLCYRNGSWLVYYHHGDFETNLVELVKNKAWVHISDNNFQQEENPFLLEEALKSSGPDAKRFVFHIEKNIEHSQLKKIHQAKAYIIFPAFSLDLQPRFQFITEKFKKKKLDFKAYFLYQEFMQ